MEAQLMQIQAKPTDYKICRFCGKLNWYENENCIECDTKDNFHKHGLGVSKFIDNEYKFWINETTMTEEEVDTLKLEV